MALVSMSNSKSLSKRLLSTRYLAHSITGIAPWKADTLKLLYSDPVRTSLEAYTLKMLRRELDQLQPRVHLEPQDQERQVDSRDANVHAPSMFTGKPVPFKIAINEWYISHPISAKVGTDHSMAFEIYGKIAGRDQVPGDEEF